jgi:Zn-dependent M28 family amino/carboxypeptidase
MVMPEVDEEHLRRDVEHLSGALAHRDSNNYKTLVQTTEYISSRFSALHAPTRLQSYELDGEIHSNVIARFGPEQGAPVVIGAHYDAEAHTPGADDNASGVAGLLELARLFAENPPTVPVELVAYTLEEPPFFRTEDMGSRRHAAGLMKAGIKPRLVQVMEMIGYFDDRPGSQSYPLAALRWLYPDRGNFIAVVGKLADTRETRLVKTAMASASELAVESINAPARLVGIDFSDHASYWQHGIPAIMVTDTAFYRNPNYHKASDTADTLDYRRMSQVVKGIYAVVKHVEAEHAE